MPDQFGRLNLAEIRTYVLRNLVSYTPSNVDATSGAESGTPSLGFNWQFSKDNLNLRINSATTLTSLLVNANNETILAKEVLYDAIPGVFDYQRPVDCVQLRGLWWKDPAITADSATPEDYFPMSMQDTFQTSQLATSVNMTRPTWRMFGNVFHLNQDPGDYTQSINEQGILVRYIRRMTYLASDTSYIDFPFANEVQECIIWETTLDCLTTQSEVIDSGLVKAKLDYWKAQLELLVRNQYRPPEIQMKGPAIVKNTFSGR